MNKTFVREIKDRDQLESVFLVKDMTTAMAKNGKPYLTIKLMDKTGDIDARVWDNVDQFCALFDKDDFIRVRAKASVYLGKMQLVVSDLSRIPDAQVNLADFLPESPRSIAEMLEEFNALLGTIGDRNLKALLSSFFDEPKFMGLYSTAPAAKGMHHVYLGGLLEHSLAVAKLVDQIVPLYSGLNRDLLIAGALLHDVGKVREMTYFRSFDYSDEGKLLGHITIGVEMIHEKIMNLPEFPEQLSMLLKHMLLSHHGQYEFGSPKRPKTVEATILNYLDDLDSKINGIRTHIGKELEGQSRWTAYHRLYDRYFYMDNCLPEDELEEQCRATEAVPSPQLSPAPVPAEPKKVDQQKKGFGNNPFEQLRAQTPDLFNS